MYMLQYSLLSNKIHVIMSIFSINFLMNSDTITPFSGLP
jgi:hypothetical protein